MTEDLAISYNVNYDPILTFITVYRSADRIKQRSLLWPTVINLEQPLLARHFRPQMEFLDIHSALYWRIKKKSYYY